MRKHHPAFPLGLLLLTLALACLPSAQAQDYTSTAATPSSTYQEYSHARIVRLSLVDGDVQILRPDAQAWEDALVNLPIQQGYSLATGRGRAEVELESGATIRVAEDSVLEFTELAMGDGARITRLSLTQGTATFYANLSRHDIFSVATPFVDVDIPDDARFRVDVYAGGSKVAVLKGKVTVETGAGRYELAKGRSLIFQQAATEQITLARNAEPDEWDRWVADRDEVFTTAQRSSQRYTNAPVSYSYGMADLWNYGFWSYNTIYGYVWRPYDITHGWSPYVRGRWVYYPRLGWTWVSIEPWGWTPYHYGRWAVTSNGWVWIPPYRWDRWHPGLVAWTHVGNQVGWCPLGPRDHVGGTFQNPQGGIVITNTPTGVVSGRPNVPQHFTKKDMPEFSSDPRFGGLHSGPHTLAGLDPQTGREQPRAGFAGSTGNTNPRRPGALPPREEIAEEPGIVYDPAEKQFVNNPRVPVRPAAIDRDAPADPAGGVRGRPTPTAPSAQPAAPSRDPQSDATRPASPPRPSWGSRPQTPQTPPRAAPPPRPARPSTQSPPRANPPRSSAPPPRAAPPRPAPQPRATPPRPAPRPSSSGWKSSSRPSPRAQSPSRARPTRSRPARPRQKPQDKG